MNIYILDTSRELLGIIDTYQSFIWTERYYEAGDCELYIPATRENSELVQAGNYIATKPNGMLCYIEKVEAKTDANNGMWLIVKGKDARNLLNRRVNIMRTYVTVYAESTINYLITHNVTDPSNTHRKIDGITVNTALGKNDMYIVDMDFFYVFDKVVEICRRFGYGSRMLWNPAAGTMDFELYIGTDRSKSQSDVTPLVFSEQFENLVSTDYIEDYSTFKNMGYITGEGQGNERLLATISKPDAAGLNRYELYIDGGSISAKTDDGTLNPQQYQSALQAFGWGELDKHLTTLSFTGTIANRMYTYGVDYELGDIITFQSPLGVSYDARITQVIESDDTQNGHIWIPSFEFIRVTE